MITIAMVHQPKDMSQHMWSINTDVFPIVYEAYKNWPGVKAYRLTGQEKYYEPTWTPNCDECTKVRSYVVGSTPSNEATARPSLTFIDLKTKG